MQALEREPPPSLNPKVLEILITEEEPAMPKETKHQKGKKETKPILIPNSTIPK